MILMKNIIFSFFYHGSILLLPKSVKVTGYVSPPGDVLITCDWLTLTFDHLLI